MSGICGNRVFPLRRMVSLCVNLRKAYSRARLNRLFTE